MNNIIILETSKINAIYNSKEILDKTVIEHLTSKVKVLDINNVLVISKNNIVNVDNIYEEGYSVIIKDDVFIFDETILKDLVNYYLLKKSLITFHKDKNNTGIFCINNNLLLKYKKYILTPNINIDILLNVLKKEKNKIYKFKDKKIESFKKIVNSFDISYIENRLRKDNIKKHLKNGVKIENLETITIGENVKIGHNVTICQGTILLGDTEVSDNCIIGPYSYIKNTKIGKDSKCVYSVINDSLIGNNVSIGPFTQIRMNSVIGDGDRIGNFVEIKNSMLGNKTNVAHLTYIGDTTCGNYVNWGCGTVTVNYDGKNKYRTIIGDKVFIGCNTNLIAPVAIESDSFIAAGSTITNNIEKGSFAIARAKQINKIDYAKKYNFKKDKEITNVFKVIRCKDYKECCAVASDIISTSMKQNPNITLGLATGSTPIGIYKNLIKDYEDGKISFKNIKTFNLDEYVGLEKENPNSYHYFMFDNFFKYIDIKKENINIPCCVNGDLSECEKYNSKLNKNKIDIQLLGIGGNGHIGFNEPGTSFDQETFIVELSNETREDNKRFFNSLDEVPKKAITMGIKNILKAEQIILVASGKNKAEAIKMLLSKKISPKFPASALHYHKNVVIIIDSDAALLLD